MFLCSEFLKTCYLNLKIVAKLKKYFSLQKKKSNFVNIEKNYHAG
jgi:hypothetical protein